MRSKCAAIGTVAVLFIAEAVAAQTPATAHPPHHGAAQSDSSAPPSSGRDPDKLLTVTGCLMRRAAPVAALASASPDGAPTFVVAAVRTSGHHQGGLGGMRSAASAPGASSATSHDHDTQAVGTSGTAGEPRTDGAATNIDETQTFTITGVDLAELTALEGKRVEVTGQIDTAAVRDSQSISDTNTTPRSGKRVDPDAAPLVVDSIRGVEGGCPEDQSR